MKEYVQIQGKNSVSFLQINSYFFQILEYLTEQESFKSYYKISYTDQSIDFSDHIGMFQNEVYFIRTYNKLFSHKYDVRNIEEFKQWSVLIRKNKWINQVRKNTIKNWSENVVHKMIQHKRQHRINEIFNPRLEDTIYLAC